jgi:hypothetical protein
MDRQRIGVLTFHRCINYGSYWQARCLIEALRARGYNPVLLEHQSDRVNRAEWRCALQPVLPTLVPKSDRPLYADKVRKFFAAFAALPGSPCFSLDDPAAMESYDRVIVGSDEVWNLRHPWYGGCPLFYGDGIRAKQLVAYAASFGSCPADAGLDRPWAERLRRFETIAVRDENSRQIIQDALDLDPAVVLDPCLLWPPDAQEYEGARQPPYVAVYGHNFTPAFSRAVRRWAQERGYPLVSIGYRNDWADVQWLTAGPHDFPHFISRAAAVATNFFHGCVFALINAKPFICERSAYRAGKLSWLKAVGAERRLVCETTPQDDYCALLSAPLDPAIPCHIAALRQMSNRYLDRVLN